MTINAKVIDSMRQFAESYAKSTDTFFCIDPDVTESVIQGLSKINNFSVLLYVHAVIMITKKMKLAWHIGIVHVYQCAKEKNVIVCFF